MWYSSYKLEASVSDGLVRGRMALSPPAPGPGRGPRSPLVTYHLADASRMCYVLVATVGWYGELKNTAHRKVDPEAREADSRRAGNSRR